MNTSQYFEMIHDIRHTTISTVGLDGTPRSRQIDTMLVDDEKLYFLTARGKDFYKELLMGGTVAITGMNDHWQSIRMWGKIKPVGQSLLDKIFECNPSMNTVYPGDTRDILEVFCLYEGQGEFFSLEKEPIERHSFCFGNIEIDVKGFVITSSCVGCARCKRGCPQQCILQGEPFQIVQEHCLHCGRCVQLCPVNAIKARGE